MNLLLNTHSFLWFAENSSELSKLAKSEIENMNNRCFLSIASLWELTIKLSLNKLELNQPFDGIPALLNINNIEILPLEFKHLKQLFLLPFHHRDPFDRLILSQAISQDLVIVTKDGVFEKYTSNIIW